MLFGGMECGVWLGNIMVIRDIIKTYPEDPPMTAIFLPASLLILPIVYIVCIVCIALFANFDSYIVYVYVKRRC